MIDRMTDTTASATAVSDIVQRAARSRKRSRRVATFTELVATVALVLSIAAILTVFSIQSAGAASLETLSFSESERIGIVVALAFIMAAMGGLTAAMVRKTVGASKRARRRH